MSQRRTRRGVQGAPSKLCPRSPCIVQMNKSMDGSCSPRCMLRCHRLDTCSHPTMWNTSSLTSDPSSLNRKLQVPRPSLGNRHISEVRNRWRERLSHRSVAAGLPTRVEARATGQSVAQGAIGRPPLDGVVACALRAAKSIALPCRYAGRSGSFAAGGSRTHHCPPRTVVNIQIEALRTSTQMARSPPKRVKSRVITLSMPGGQSNSKETGFSLSRQVK